MDDDNQSDGVGTWRLLTGAMFVAACALGLFAYSEHQRSEQLTALLTAAEQQSTGLRSELHRAANEISALQQAAAANEATLKEVSKPDLPISVGFRKPFFGNGLVAVFRNNSNTALEVSAVFSSPTTGQKREGNLVIPPGAVQEFGQREGWAFASGQRIELSNNNFRSGTAEVP